MPANSCRTAQSTHQLCPAETAPIESEPAPRQPRPLQALKAGFDNGYLSVLLTLAFCLAVPVGGIGIVVAIAALGAVGSKPRFFSDVIPARFRDWRQSQAFGFLLIVLLSTLLELVLVLHHHEPLREGENQLKQYAGAVLVVFAMRRYPVNAVVWGAAIGGAAAGLAALYDVGWLHLPRAEGPTNPIRFGMLAALFAVLALIGLLYGQLSPRGRVVAFCGIAGSIIALFLSGSRGAVLTLPFVLLLLLPRLWMYSRRIAVLSAVLFLLFSVALGGWQLNMLRKDAASPATAITAFLTGTMLSDESTRDRLEMLKLAWRLFSENPIAGVGNDGWTQAVVRQIETSPPAVAFDVPFNQPHNQIANDFAKGGIIRGVGGLLLMLAPLYWFARQRPFAPERRSLAPLLGLVTCVAFGLFGMTEAVLDLSLTASIYIILVCYLLGAMDENSRRIAQPAAVGMVFP